MNNFSHIKFVNYTVFVVAIANFILLQYNILCADGYIFSTDSHNRYTDVSETIASS